MVPHCMGMLYGHSGATLKIGIKREEEAYYPKLAPLYVFFQTVTIRIRGHTT